MNVKELVDFVRVGMITPLEASVSFNNIDDEILSAVKSEANVVLEKGLSEDSVLANIERIRVKRLLDFINGSELYIGDYLPIALLNKHISECVKSYCKKNGVLSTDEINSLVKEQVKRNVELYIGKEVEEVIEAETLCKRWGVSKIVLDNYIKRGIIKTHKIGDSSIFKLKDVESLEKDGIVMKRE